MYFQVKCQFYHYGYYKTELNLNKGILTVNIDISL